MQNRFEQFSQNIIAMHTGSAGAFDPARMMFPPEEKEASSQEMQNLYMTNVYRIQNLTEENYLYRQNFQFLTQMFEKQIHKKLYPQVERQVEKTIRQELPKAEDRVIREMTKELHTLVKESGVEQLRVLEKEAKEEQKVLLRKIENIYNSSVYVNVQAEKYPKRQRKYQWSGGERSENRECQRPEHMASYTDHISAGTERSTDS